MSYLLNIKLFNNFFKNNWYGEWIYINDVAVGESYNFSYKKISESEIINTSESSSSSESEDKDIHLLKTVLNTCIKDSKVVVVIYDWSSNTAYLKTGFTISETGKPLDIKYRPGFTSFIVSSRAPSIKKDIQSNSTGIDNFVKCDGNDFVLQNQKFIPVGFNAYWLGFNEKYTYPTNDQIEEMFIVANILGATVIRSHTLGFSSGTYNSLRPYNNYINYHAWVSIDYAFFMAKKYNIRLICPLTDSYNYYHGNYGDFCKTRGVSKEAFWTDFNVRSDFKDYISQWLNHVNPYTGKSIKDSPELCMIELGNELGNIRPYNGSKSIPTKEWISDISAYIKSIDNNHIILSGTDEQLGKCGEFDIPTLDCYSNHFYYKDYMRLKTQSDYASLIKKPYIISEFNPHFDKKWFVDIESNTNVKGTIFWNMYPHELGYRRGPPVEHNDGYTLHYPESRVKLLLISNHFRRMRGLPEITEL
jgi:mannan endo-1,4-beta-mannosidase